MFRNAAYKPQRLRLQTLYRPPLTIVAEMGTKQVHFKRLREVDMMYQHLARRQLIAEAKALMYAQ